jgi:hypothetical protein
MADTPTNPSSYPQQTLRSAEFKDIYSNFVRMGVSGSDISIIFGKLVDSPLGFNVVEDQAIIRMSPHQFKTFLSQATKTLNAWEEVFGAVNESMKSSPQEAITDGVRRLKEALDKGMS